MKEPMKFELPPDEKGGNSEPIITPEHLSQKNLPTSLGEQISSTAKNKGSEEENTRKIEEIKADLNTSIIDAELVTKNEIIETPEVFIKPTLDNFISLTKKIHDYLTDFERKHVPIDITAENFWKTLELQTEEIARTIHGRYPVFYYDRPQTNTEGVVEYGQNTMPFSQSPVLGENPIFMEIMIRDTFNRLVQDKIIESESFEDFRSALFIPITDRKFTPEYRNEDKNKIIEAQRKAWEEITKKYSKKEILKVIKERKDVLYAIYALGTDKEKLIVNPALKTDERIRAASIAYRTANEKQDDVWDHEITRVSLEPSLAYLKRFYFF